jgi:hypothetical protein
VRFFVLCNHVLLFLIITVLKEETAPKETRIKYVKKKTKIIKSKKKEKKNEKYTNLLDSLAFLECH